MSWEVNSVNVNSVDAQLYDSPFSDYSAHQARNGSKIRMAHANKLFTPTRTAEELIPKSAPMPNKQELMRFQLDGNKMTNTISGAQVELPSKKTETKEVPAVPVAPVEPPASTTSESYHTPKWQGVRARTGYMNDRKSQREDYHTPKWRGVKARTGYMHDRKKENFSKGGSAAIVIVVILAILVLAFLLWKFVWVPKHGSNRMRSLLEGAYITMNIPNTNDEINEDDYIDDSYDESSEYEIDNTDENGNILFGGKRKAKKSKKSRESKSGKKVRKCNCGHCAYCLKKKAKKSKKAGKR